MATGRFAIWPVIAAACVALSGCQPSRQAFQMDSDSRTPMLGLEFAPQKPAADVTGIVHRSEPDAEAVSASKESVRVEDTAEPSGWSKLWEKFSRPKRIPLPRTDGDQHDSDEQPATPVAAGSADFS